MTRQLPVNCRLRNDRQVIKESQVCLVLGQSFRVRVPDLDLGLGAYDLGCFGKFC